MPYMESLPLDGVLGTEGIEVVGATKRLKIEVPACAAVEVGASSY